jgi:hypothetical protein
MKLLVICYSLFDDGVEWGIRLPGGVFVDGMGKWGNSD